MSFRKQLGSRRGVTLIEAVLFISIALGLIVGGLVFFQQASLAQRTNDAVRSISSLASETRAAYRTQQSFAGLTPAVLINSGAVPSSAINGTNIRNEWGGDALIGPTPALGTIAADSAFFIEYTNIPAAACVRLATATAGTGPVGAGIAAVQVTPANDSDANTTDADLVGGTAVTGFLNTNFSTSGQVNVTPVQAANACSTGSRDLRITFIR